MNHVCVRGAPPCACVVSSTRTTIAFFLPRGVTPSSFETFFLFMFACK